MYLRSAKLLFACLLAVHTTFANEPKLTPGKQVAVQNDAYNYLLFVPDKYEQQDQKWPVIVFLHGAGERGDDLEVVKKHGPPKIVEKKPDFGFVVISPQVPLNERWEAKKVAAIIDDVAKSVRIDPQRIYMTGLSMGGAGTWSFAAEYPDRLAAMAPICGSAELSIVEKIKHIPNWVVIGGKDRPELVQRNDELIEALKKAGGKPKYTLYPDAGHDSWTQTYNNPEFYQWLLEQKAK